MHPSLLLLLLLSPIFYNAGFSCCEMLKTSGTVTSHFSFFVINIVHFWLNPTPPRIKPHYPKSGNDA